MRKFAIIAVGLVALLVGVVALPPTSHASADALVVVVFVRHNGAPAPARVTIRDEQGNEQSCEADESGSCQIEGVGPGRHLVETGEPGARVTRPVMIPEEGKVSLIVSVP
jgi:hypothetical protein